MVAQPGPRGPESGRDASRTSEGPARGGPGHISGAGLAGEVGGVGSSLPRLLLVCWATVTDCHRRGLHTAQTYSLTVLGSRSPNQGLSRAILSWRAAGRVLPGLFLASRACWSPSCFLACRHITPVSASIVTWPSPCVQTSRFLLGHQLLDRGPP